MRGGFLGEVRRAGLAELALGVPANLGAHPVAAARALVKLRLDLGDRGLEGVVPGFAAQAILRVFGGGAGVPQRATAEQRAQPLRDLRADAERRRVVGRPEAVP